jgi:hypothetical protein
MEIVEIVEIQEQKSSGMVYRHIVAHFEHCLLISHAMH